MSAKVHLTHDEIISTLIHSSLPTVVVEGSDDVIIFRRMEDDFSDIGLSVLGVGGRDTVLKIFDRRNELPDPKNVVFIADQDLWVIFGIPSQYKNGALIFTRGYSIENDVFKDGKLETLMTASERSKFDDEILKIAKLFALRVSRHLRGMDAALNFHPAEVLDQPVKMADALKLEVNEIHPHNVQATIDADPCTMLRGKLLFAVLMRHLSYKGRAAKHNHRSIFEYVAVNRGPLLQETFKKVGERLAV